MLGVPIPATALQGMDSLLSIVQMPKGVPVGTLAIGASGAANAGLLAAQILATTDAALREKMCAWRLARRDEVLAQAIEDDGTGSHGVERVSAAGSKAVAKPILPGATIGIFGGGQLGRMTAMAARAMGYRIQVLDPDPACAARFVVDACIEASWDDAREAANLARGCDVVTLEIEQISLASMDAAANFAPVRPGRAMLASDSGPDRAEGLAEEEWLSGWGLSRGAIAG